MAELDDEGLQPDNVASYEFSHRGEFGDAYVDGRMLTAGHSAATCAPDDVERGGARGIRNGYGSEGDPIGAALRGRHVGGPASATAHRNKRGPGEACGSSKGAGTPMGVWLAGHAMIVLRSGSGVQKQEATA